MAKSYEELKAEIEANRVGIEGSWHQLSELGGVFKNIGDLIYPPILRQLEITEEILDTTQSTMVVLTGGKP